MCCSCLHVKTCCCGCSLRTGVLIIGWVFLVLSVIVILYSIVVIAKGETEDDRIRKCAGPEQCGKESSSETYEKSVECMRSCRNYARYLNSMSLYVNSWNSVVILVVSIFLLVGVYADVPILLPIYVYVEIFAMIVYTLMNFVILALNQLETYYTVLVLFFLLLWWLLEIYLCVVVYSLYRTMTKPDQYPGGDRIVVRPGPPYYYAQYPQQEMPQ